MKRKDRFEGVILNWRFFDIIPEDMTQEQIAEMFGVSTATINMLKSGKRNPDVRWIEVVAQKFNIPTWQLFVDPKDVIPKEYIQLMEDFKSLDPERKRMVEDALLASRVRKQEAQKKTDSVNGSLPNGHKNFKTPRKKRGN